MQTVHSAEGILRTRRYGVDTGLVFTLYAAITIIAGLSITGTGIRGLPGVPQWRASLIWVAGTLMAAAGCAAVGLAFNQDPVGRRRALYAFATGHVLVGLFGWSQWGIYWGDHGLPQWVALAPLAAGAVLFGVAGLDSQAWATDDRRLLSAHPIRSTYDEHIRQLARREERARLARDLHDAVKQQLFVIQTAAATAEARFESDSDGARTALADVRTAAREATTEMEALLEELQAAPMENTGLVEALRKQCEALAFRTGAAVRFDPGALPANGSVIPGAHEAIYRVAQEALANVARHTRASHVTVSLGAAAARFEMRVVDDGAGFDASAATRGMGTANMMSRAAEIGGSLTTVSGSSGTEVALSVPLVNPAVRVAWFHVGVLGLLVLSLMIASALRGDTTDRTGFLFLPPLAVGLIWRLIAAYRQERRQATP